MAKLLISVHDAVWGLPTLLIILILGLFFTAALRIPQFRLFPLAFQMLFRDEKTPGAVSPRQALCTALGATVGTGNIVGVAGAVCLGGPGAVFWIWVFGFLGMGLKYAEIVLAMRYRIRKDGEFIGGTMYLIDCGMGHSWKWLAVLYCVLGLFASFGIGNAVQVNAVIIGAQSLLRCFRIRELPALRAVFGILLAAAFGIQMLTGATGIGKTSEKAVPVSAGVYCLLCIGILLRGWRSIPTVLREIFLGAFSPASVTGGMIGSFFTCVRIGAARGAFSNEAGMGTAAIAHAGTAESDPVSQGALGILEVFVDTMVICTLTACAILCSGVPIPFGQDAGPVLVMDAFAFAYGEWSNVIMPLIISIFAAATILGWSLYGIRFFTFLFGSRLLPVYVGVQMGVILLSSVLDTSPVWRFSEMLNGIMMYPSLFALFSLFPELIRITLEYNHGE